MSVLVVGSIAFDSISTPQGTRKELLGGSATYFALSANILSKVRLVGVVGSDFPAKYIKYFSRKGIDIQGLKTTKGRTFRWHGCYENDMNQRRTIKTELGVFQNFQPQIPDDYKKTEVIFLANIDPDLQLDVLSKIKQFKYVISDTMNYWIENKISSVIKVLRKVDIALLNDGEAKQLFKTYNLILAAKRCLKLGPKFVIIKKGEHGSILFSKKSVYSTVAYPLEKVIDPTGAGDSFAGGVCSYIENQGYLNEKILRKAIVYGNIVASFNVEGFGIANLDKLTLKKIKKRFQEFKKIIISDEI